ncbi:MAG: glycosyltransferase [Bryobacteraceae bacterium]|nr:glycosyltransferase [Bryobacteraceae bacterium]
MSRFLRALPYLILAPFLSIIAIAALAISDLASRLRRRPAPPLDRQPDTTAASVVIPSWNARDLLEKYLPSVIEALAANGKNELIVVDNASTDGSADYVKAVFPGVRVLTLESNRGFGGGSNAGFEAATNDIVVLLNNDMRVEPDFLGPLLEGFTDEKVFSVSCQIFFSDTEKKREETGLTQGWWSNGGLRVRHRIDEAVNRVFPCFYGGGGSTAYDRRKFLELGGFDPLLAPFYLEDTDLGYMAWKRGWKVLYEPRSKVFHEHRGTIGKRFTPEQIQNVLHKNFILFCWKNIHEWPRLLSQFLFAFAGAIVSAAFGNSPERPTASAIWRAFIQLPAALSSRSRARRLAYVSDTEAFLRPLGGYFRDRFEARDPSPDPLRVLFVSPYPISPPTHGGGVFMLQTCRQLLRHCELHLVVLLDHPPERDAHEELAAACASAEFLLRPIGQARRMASLLPHAVREFQIDELDWLIHRKICLDRVDVLQLEYLTMGQYAGRYDRLVCALFEHDVYFQSIARSLLRMRGTLARFKAAYEYMTALRYELRLLPRFDMVQVCSPDNGAYLRGFLPKLASRLDDRLRAGIDVAAYEFRPDGREADTMLFLGSFRHQPNLQALDWFAEEILPRVLAARPQARLVVVGSEPPLRHYLADASAAVEFRGFVPDVREPLSRYGVFVCPILSGSGVRVKLLEAFASGMPVVSTRLGAEGLASGDGAICALADDAETFARRVVELLADPERAAEMAARARAQVAEHRDIGPLTARLAEAYRALVEAKRIPTQTAAADSAAFSR